MSIARPARTLLLTFLLVVRATGVLAQVASSGANVTGRVVDAASMAGVAGATVVADAKVATTDKDGRFALTLPHGAVRLVVAADGYLAEQVDVVASAQPVTIEVRPAQSLAVQGGSDRERHGARDRPPAGDDRGEPAAGAEHRRSRRQHLPGAADAARA